MIAIDRGKREKLYRLFDAYEWNYLTDAILEGTVGRALADDADDPHAAVLEVPSLHLSIVGGDAGHPSARIYVEQIPKQTAIFFASEGWEALVQTIHGSSSIMV
ncbi:MAG: hypothetical protein ACK2U9_04985, partial [Anaerolineae bacterium]